MKHDYSLRELEMATASFPLLDILQLADSTFPSGSYAHSFGLEWLDAQGELDLESILRVRLFESLARVELPLLREAYEAAGVARLIELDQLADVLTPVREARQASRSIGHSFLRAAVKVRPGGLPARAAASGVEHQPIVLGSVLRHWDITLEDGLAVHAWQTLRQQLSAAQRLGRIGQSGVQQLLQNLKPAIRAAIDRSQRVPLDEAGCFTPWLDLAGMRHDHQFSRLFIS
ncbi:MAG TPA: urease accessory UreF family protein [Chloroflexota bacterium]|jgi:urease accessory protein|nr:urease accessory UreF family protein [Chloroflexota bacterium]